MQENKPQYMKKILFAMMGMAIMSAYAAPLTPAEALARLGENDHRRASAQESPRQLATYNDADGNPAIYIYTYAGDRGFMLLSADDATPALLGYSETNSFALDGSATSVASWLDSYAEQIKASRGLPRYEAPSTRADDMAPVGPLVKSNWDQTAPYYNDCPKYGARRCVTGCVATAMAQVMNYWKFPERGQDQISYLSQEIGQQLSMDFSTVEFDWDNMLDKYTGGNYSAEEAKAVSTLMLAAGHSVMMQYTPWESGAYSKDIAAAMIKYFGYDQGVTNRKNNEFGSSIWNEVVYKELITTGPVIYTGRSMDGAHCFVCDGYDGNGRFHINWGWGGLSDGYYLLNALNPVEIGTGGHLNGYNIDQDIVVGIMPPQGRLTSEGIKIENAASDSGNVKGWGYTYRIANYFDIQLSATVRVTGGRIASPLYVTIYEVDPSTLSNVKKVYEDTFDQPIDITSGVETYTKQVKLTDHKGELYSLFVAYDLKGARTTIDNLLMAPSYAGLGTVGVSDAALALNSDGRRVWTDAEGFASLKVYDVKGACVAEADGESPELNLETLGAGIYVAVARGESGETATLKLHLR